jgi:signal transduction histidine kinase/HAMP domain-containing protein
VSETEPAAPSRASPEPPRPRVWHRLRYKLVFLLVSATAVVFALQSWQTIRYVNAAVLDVTEQASVTDINEIRAVLEEQMLSGDRRALVRLVDVIGQAPGVTWVGVVDANGTAKVTSDHAAPLLRFAEDSPEQQALRAWQASGGLQPLTRVAGDGAALRTLSPLPNGQACQRCHSPPSRVNGMLIIDRSLTPLQRTVALSQQHLLMGGAILLALLLGIIGLAVDRTVLQRVERLRATTRSLGRGDLAARAQDSSRDELGDLARDFDDMAQRLEAAMLAVAAQRRELEELVNGIADGVVVLDLAGRVVTVNKACARRIGGAPPAAGTAYRHLVRAAGFEVAEAVALPAERALASGALEKEIVRAGNGERTEELYALPLRSPDGATTAIIEVWRDISDRRELEAGLEQSERLASLGVLASSVAHEVGNPLASIVTAVDGLLARLPAATDGSSDEIRDYLEIVRKQVFRCHLVTERLLGFARLPSGGDAMVDVAKAAREVLALVRHEARAQGVDCEVRAPGLVLATAPDMLVEQVFLNLVLNALKAMPTGGRLVVEVSGDDERVAVSFSDTGPGIPEELGRHLFKPFRRATQDRNGTGLGLFISQALMARAGGVIEVESRPGRGTTFLVRLRRAVERPITPPIRREGSPQ